MIIINSNSLLGTDATIAQHIATIQQREYASKENNYIAPTTLGLALIDGYKKMGFNLDKPDLRARVCNKVFYMFLGE